MSVCWWWWICRSVNVKSRIYPEKDWRTALVIHLIARQVRTCTADSEATAHFVVGVDRSFLHCEKHRTRPPREGAFTFTPPDSKGKEYSPDGALEGINVIGVRALT